MKKLMAFVLEKYDMPVKKPKEDPFRPQFQRAHINGRCVDVVRHEDGAYNYFIYDQHPTRGWEAVARGAADSEEACKMLATRAAKEQ